MRSQVRFVWTKPPTTAFKARVYVVALDNALGQLLNYYWAPLVEAYAKINAPWVDRTGNARQTLAAFGVKKSGVWWLVLRQWMDYGKWLELRWGGRYAIVLPALQQHYGEVWKSVKALVNDNTP